MGQETAWAAYRKGSGDRKEAAGEKCKECALIHAKGYANLSWEEVLARCKTVPEFATQFREAKRRLRGEVQAVQESANNIVNFSLRCTQAYDFISVTELEDTMELKSLASVQELPWTSIPDEHGMKQTGVLVKRPEPRRVHISWSQELSASSSLLTGTIVRSGQAHDTCEAAAQTRADAKGLNTNALTQDKLQDIIATVKETRRLAAAAAAQSGAPRPAAPLAVTTASTEEAEEEDASIVEVDPELEAVMNSNRQQAPSAAESSKASRGRGRGKGSKKGGRKRLGASESGEPDCVQPPAVKRKLRVAPADDVSVAGSGRQTVLSTSPADKNIEGARKWLRELSVAKALSGKRVNNDLYQSRRALEQ
eukprot:6459458-Amphidinium_carterae.1